MPAQILITALQAAARVTRTINWNKRCGTVVHQPEPGDTKACIMTVMVTHTHTHYRQRLSATSGSLALWYENIA